MQYILHTHPITGIYTLYTHTLKYYSTLKNTVLIQAAESWKHSKKNKSITENYFIWDDYGMWV